VSLKSIEPSASDRHPANGVAQLDIGGQTTISARRFPIRLCYLYRLEHVFEHSVCISLDQQ